MPRIVLGARAVSVFKTYNSALLVKWQGKINEGDREGESWSYN